MLGRVFASRVAMLSLVLGLAAANAAPEKPVLMVIYFDNLTGKPEQDVLKKGLADMIITDLVAYDGVTVVERDKLESVLDELHLQRSRPFDRATRAKVGKLVGARYLISGSLQGVTPEIRIDARLTDITTGVDVTAASVRGAPDKLFDLEQQLVAKLTASIDAKLASNVAARKMKGVDVETVLAYARGLDLEDKGKLEEARKQYSEVLKKQPTFALPRDHTEKLLRKMVDAETTRSAALSSAAGTLAKAVDQILAGNFDPLAEAKQGEYLAMRMLRGRLLGRLLKEHLITAGYSVVIKGHEAAALKLLREIHHNHELLREEAARFHQQHASSFVDLRLAGDLDRIAKEAHLEGIGSESIDDDRLLSEAARFVLLGRVSEGAQDYRIAPALGDLDPKLGSAMFAALDREVDARIRTNKARAEHTVSSLLELQADALFRAGKTEAGVAKLQRFLDEYPTSTEFAGVTRKINHALGVEFSPSEDDLLNYPDKGLKQCDYFILYRGGSAIVERRIAVKGVAAIGETIAEMEHACGARPILWNSLYSLFANMAARYGECDLARDLWRKYLAHNGSRSDFEAYQRHQHDCVISL